ncbi:hypothetical protein P4G69_16105 [Bacillus cereus]|nr:hypothetical protein [Bacillus cereus]MEB8728557.1 hypothetical protein [Bacillus cereus]
MKLTKEERIRLTYQIGDIIEQKCRRCYYNRSDDASFSINICAKCPTGQTLRQLGRYFDTEPRSRGGKTGNMPDGLTPARVRELNDQGIHRWRKQGLWQGPNQVPKKSSKRKRRNRHDESD